SNMNDTPENKRRCAGLAAAFTGALLLLVAPLMAAAADNSVKFGAPPWPGEQVKAEVVSQILEAVGYDTSVMNAGWDILLQGVANGDIDVDLGIWRPTQNSIVDPMIDSGAVTHVVTNIDDAKYSVVVPQYVCDAGVTSFTDLNDHADQFDAKIFGIEAGNDGNEIMNDAIDDNTYDLAGWTLVPSSTAGMLSEAQRAFDRDEWIAFLGWKPHWMNIVMDLCYLDDPEAIWGGSSSVHTVANPDYIEAHPQLNKFLENMIIPAAVQSDWIYTFGYEEVSLEQTAADWIRANEE